MRAGAVTVVLVLSVARPAAATSCVKTISETFEIRIAGVYEGKREVAVPAELGALDRLYGLRDGSVLVWDEAMEEYQLFFRLKRPLTPTTAVAAYIEASKQRYRRTPCGNVAYFTPASPGHYGFDQDRDDGAPPGMAEPTLILASGRDVVELRYRVGRRRYRAVYQVLCARFESWQKPDEPCAPSGDAAAPASPPPPVEEPPAEPDEPPAEEKVTEPAEPTSPAPVEPTRPEPVESARVESPAHPAASAPPAVPASGGRCSVAPPRPASWSVWLLLALCGRRRGRRGS